MSENGTTEVVGYVVTAKMLGSFAGGAKDVELAVRDAAELAALLRVLEFNDPRGGITVRRETLFGVIP